MSICSKKPESVGEIEPPLEGKLVENLPFMSICSNKSKRIVQTELLFLRNMAETRLPLPTVSTAVAPSTVMRNNSDQKRSWLEKPWSRRVRIREKPSVLTYGTSIYGTTPYATTIH